MRHARILAAAILLASCNTELPHEAPYDALSPYEKQAKGQVTGAVRLEGESDHSQVTVQLQNSDRTYSVDTAADGTVKLTGVVPGTYELSLRTRYFQAISDTVEVVLGEELDLGAKQLELNRALVFGSALAERVANGSLVSSGGVVVSLSKIGSVRASADASGSPSLKRMAQESTSATYTTISSASGRFQFAEVPAGRYAVFAAGEEGGETKVAEVLVTGEGDARLEDIVMRPLTGFFNIVGTANGGESSVYTTTAVVTLELIATNAQTMKIAESGDGTTESCLDALDTKTPEPYNSQRQYSFVGEGRKLLCVQYVDVDGKETEPVFGSIISDSTAPSSVNVLPITNNGYSRNLNVFANLLATDEVPGVTTSGIAAFAVGDTAVGSLTAPKQVFLSTVQLNFPGDGTFTRYVRVVDAAGNASDPFEFTVTVDRSVPTLGAAAYLASLDGTPLGAVTNDRSIKLISSVADSSPLEMQLTINGLTGPWEPFQAERAIDLPPASIAAGENRTVSARVRDAAGNVVDLINSASVVLDSQAPSSAVLTFAASTVSNATVTANFSATNADYVELSEDISFLAPTVLTYRTSEPWTFSNTGDGLKTLYARFADNAGNYSPVVAANVVLDQTPPENTAFTIAQASPTKQSTLNLSLSAIGATQMSISESACASYWEAYAQNKAHILSNTTEGNKTIAVRFRDAVGNVSPCLTQSVYFDNNAPTLNAPAVSLNYGAASTSNGTVTVSFDAVGATQVKVSEDSSLADSAWMPYTATRTFSLSAGNGTKTVYAIFRDDADNQTAVVNDTIVLDTTPISTPFVTIQADVTSSTSVQVNFAASNIDEMWYSEQSDFSTGVWEPYVATKNITFSGGDGTKTLYAKFRKTSGAESTIASDSYVVDTVGPILPNVRINNGATVVSDDVVTLNLSAVDQTSGVAVYRINTVNSFGSVSNKPYQPNDLYTLSTGDGIKTLYVIYGDKAGNFSAAAAVSVTLDTTPPVIGSPTLETLGGTVIAHNDTTRESRIVLRSSVTDLTTLEMQVTTTGSFGGLGWEPYSPNKVIDLTTGSSTVSARVRDAAGNVVNLLTGVTVNLDNQAPTATFTLTSVTPTNNLTVSYTVASSEAGEMQVGTDVGFTGASWEPVGPGSLVLSAGDGIRTLYARTRDAAGNTSDIKSISVVIDRTPPQNAGFTIGSGAFTNSRALSLSYGGVEIDEVRVAEDACGGAYATHSGTGTFNIASSGDGVKTVAVQFRDAVGNETVCLTQTVSLDETAPVVNSFVINNNDASATVRTVTLAIDVTDADEMQLSENSTFSGAGWVPVTTSVNYTLSAGEGSKTVFARFRDKALNAAGPVQDSILIDTIAPVFHSVTGAHSSSVTDVTLTLTGAGADLMRLSENADFSGANWVPYNGLPTFYLANTQGAHSIYIQLADTAGNESIVRTHSVSLDSLAPDTPIVSVIGGAFTKTAGITVQTLADGAAEIRIGEQADLSDGTWVPYTQLKAYSLVGGEGAHTVYVQVRDAAQNESAIASATVTLDSIAPVVNMRADDGLGNLLTETNSTRYYMRLWVTDATDVQAQFAASNSFSGVPFEAVSTLRTWDVIAPSASAGASYNTYVKVSDAAGNSTTVGPITVLVDTVGPTAPALSLVASTVSSPTVTATFSAVNADYVEISEDISFLSPTVLTYRTSEPWTFTNTDDGVKNLYVRFADNLGNYSAVAAASVTLDQTPPENTAFSIAQASPTKQSTLNLSLTAIGATQMSVNENSCGSNWEAYAQNKAHILSNTTEGNKTVAVRFRDAVGNVSPCLTQTVYFDNNAPTLNAPAVSINYGAASTSNGTVTVSFDVVGATQVKVSEDSSLADAAWMPYTATRTFGLSAGNGTKTVYAIFRDDADNQTAVVNDTIVLDTKPISTPFVTVQAEVTSSTTVQVTFAASNIDEMWYSEQSDFSTGAWEPYVATKNITFSGGDGTKTLYAKFRKTSGAESTVASDSFVLDTTPPILPSIRVNNGATVVSSSIVTLNLSAVDETSGLGVYRLNTINSFGAIADKGYQPNDLYTLSAGDGTKTLWVVYGDRARNYSAPASVSVVLDTTAPAVGTVEVQRLDGSAIANGSTVRDGRIILVSGVSDLTTLEMQVTTNGSYAGLGWEPYNPSKVLDLTAASSTISARVRDAAGQVSDLLSGFTVNLDNLAPTATFTLTSATPTNDLTIAYTVSSSESGDVQVSADVGFAGAAWEALGAGSKSLSPGDGVRSLYARTRDAAGNISDIKTINVVVDQTPPQNAAFTITSGDFTNSRTINLTYSGVDITEVQVAEDACGGVYAPHGGTGAFTIGSAGDGVKTIAVRFRDAVGNQSGCLTKSVTLDETPPVIAAVVIDGDAQYAADRNVTVDISVSGAGEMQLSESASFTGASWVPVTTAASLTLSATDGVKTVYARFRDEANNIAGPVNDSIIFDTKAPYNGTLLVNGGAEATNDAVLNLALSAVDADEMIVGLTTDFAGSNWVPYATTATINAATDGNKTVSVRYRDLAGNQSEIYQDSILVDRQAPVVSHVKIAEAPVTNATTITLNLSVSGASEMQLSESPAFTAATWQPYFTNPAFTLAAGLDGVRTVYARFRDSAGNLSADFSASISLDRAAPTGGSIAINGGATGTTQRLVTLELGAADAVEMMLSENPLFTAAAWEPFAQQKAFTLSAGDGSKTVYAKFRDGIGNISAAVSAGIALDSSAPQVPSITIATPVDGYANQVTVPLVLSASDADYMIVSENAAFNGATWQPYAASLSFELTGTQGSHTVYAKYKDEAGNETAIVSDSVVLDTSAPVVAKVSIDEGDYAASQTIHLTLFATGADTMKIGETSDMSLITAQPYGSVAAYDLSAGEGLKTVYVEFQDAAGNKSTIYSASVTLDTIRPGTPTVSINAGAAFTTNRFVNLGISTDGSAYEMQISEDPLFGGAAWQLVRSPFSYSLQSVDDGSKPVYVRLRDRAGNVSLTGSDSINLDTAAPDHVFVSKALPPNDYANVTAVLVNLGATGADFMRTSVDGTFDTESWVAMQATTTVTVSAGDGLKTVWAQFRDTAGNLSQIAQTSFNLDTQEPIAGTLSFFEGTYTRNTNVGLQLNASGADFFQISDDGVFDTEPKNPMKPGVPVNLPPPDGVKVYWVQFSDRADNYASPVSAYIVLDTSAPIAGAPAITIDSGNTHTSTQLVNLAISVVGATEMQLRNQPFFGEDGWEPVTTATTWFLEQGDGMKTVHVRFRDAAGNIAGPFSDNIELDTRAPDVGGIFINSGNDYTGDRVLNVSIDAPGGVASEMRYSTDSAFASATWVAFNNGFTIAVSNTDGIKTVYAQFRDAAGNTSTVLQDSIVLDTTPPASATISINSGSSFTRDPNVALTLGATDTLSGVADMQLSNDGTFDTEPHEPIPPQRFWMLDGGADGTKTVWVRFRDRAGNYSTAVNAGIVLDRQPPTGTTVTLDGGAAYTTANVATVTLAASDTNGVSYYMLADNPGFGGAFWQEFTTATSFVLPSVEGPVKVFAKYRDAAGNESIPVEDQIQRDTVAPQFDGLNGPAMINTATVNLQLFAPPPPNASQMRFSEDSNFSAATWKAFNPTTTFTLSSGEGIKTIYAQLRDDAGHTSTVRSLNVTVDQTAPSIPSVSVRQGSYVNNALIELQIFADGAKQMLISRLSDFSDATWQPFNQLANFTLSGGDGTKTVYVKVRDEAGNESAAGSANVVLDTAPPVVATFRAQDSGGNVITQTQDLRYYLYLDASDGSGMTAQFSPDNNFNGAAVESITPPYTRQWDVPPPSPMNPNGEIRAAYVLVRDAAGNSTVAGPVNVTVDNIGPGAPSISLSPSLVSTTTVTVNLAANNATAVELSQDISFLAATSFSMRATTTYTLAAGDGEKRLYARFADSFGNYSVIVEGKTTLDTVAPKVQSISIDEGLYTNKLNVHLSFNVADAVQMRIAENTCGGSWGAFNEGHTHTFANTTDGLKTIAVQFRDGAGNATACYTKTITLDRTPPSFTAAKGVVINGDAGYTKNNFVSLQLNVTGATEMLIGNNAFFGGAQYMPVTSATQWGLEPGDGVRSVFVRFRDAAGNVLDGATDSITVDATPPSNTAVAINGGASYSVTNAVTLTLAADDAQAISMQISNDGIFDSEPEEPFAASKAWTLAGGDGNKNVYVRFSDAAGNKSNTVYAGIVVDTLGPIGTSISINGGSGSSSDNLGNVTLSLSAFDGSGVSRMKVTNLTAVDCATSLSLQSDEPFQSIKSWVLDNPGPNKEGMRWVCAMFRDGAGSWSSPVSDAIMYDTWFPTPGASAILINGGDLYATSTQVQVNLDSTGAAQMKLGTDAALSGASWEPYVAAKAWSFASGGDGVDRTLYVKFRDAVGNETAIYSDSITLDTVAPSSLTMALDGGEEYVAAQPNYTRDVTFEVTLGASSWSVAQVSDDVGFQSILTTATSAAVFPVAVSLSTDNRLDGAKTIYARFLDGAGNMSPIISRTINLDTAKPSPVNIVINAGAASTSAPDGIVNLSMSAADSGSGIDRMRLSNTLAGLPGASEEPYNGSKLWALSGTGANQEGHRWVWYQVADRAGNYSDPVSDTILYDTLAPQSPAISVLTTQPSASRTAELQLTAAGASEMILGHDLGFTNRSWEPYNEFRSWTFNTGGNGDTRTVYVKYRDAAGNTTSEYSADFIIDDTAPQNPSVTLSGGLERPSNSRYSSDLEFEVEALSANGGWSTAIFATDVGFTNIVGTFNFGIDTLPASYMLPSGDDGAHTVYVKFADDVGNVSTMVSDSFVIDSVGPQISRVVVNGYDITDGYSMAAVTTPAGTATIRVEATDVNGNLEEIEITESLGGSVGPTSFLPQPKTLTLNDLGNFGFRGLEITVRDKAGNSHYWSHNFAIEYATDGDPFWTMALLDPWLSVSGFTYTRDIYVELANQRPMKRYQLSDSPTFTGASWIETPSLPMGPITVPYTLTSGGDFVAKTVYGRYMDQFGRISDPMSDTIDIDDVGPDMPAVTISPSYYMGFNHEIDIVYVFEDWGERLQVSEYPDFSTYDEFDDMDSQPLDFSFSASSEGPRELYFRALDAAGNESDVYVWDFFADLTPPMLNSVVLNGGATLTNSLTMTLELSAEDIMPGSGVSKIRISPDYWCSLGDPNTIVKPYANTISFDHWNAYGGYQNVYICAVDAAGNWSASVEVGIDVDLNAPEVNTLVVNDGDGVVNSPSISLTATSADGGIEVQIANEPTYAGAVWRPTGNDLIFVLTNGDGTKHIYARFRDEAGNISADEHITVELDSQGPTPPGIQITDIDSDGVSLYADRVELSWTAPVGVFEYELQRVVFGVDSDFKTILAPGSGTNQYADTITQPGFKHQYRIRAVDASGNWSGWSLPVEARPFEPVNEILWLRQGDQLRFELLPPAGTFSVEPQYSYADISGMVTTTQLSDNVLSWLRPTPSSDQFNEQLIVRSANQDQSLVQEANFKLPFAGVDGPDDPCSSEGELPNIESFGASLTVTMRRDCGVSVWTWTNGVWERWQAAATSGGFYGIDHKMDSTGNAHIAYSYESASPDELRYAVGSGSTWTLETVLTSTVDEYGRYPSIALDYQNVPHILSYQTNSGSSTYQIIWSRRTGGVWNSSPIATFTSALSVKPVLAADALGRLHAVYRDPDANSVVYRVYQDGTWSAPTILRANADYPAIAVSNAGVVNVVLMGGNTMYYYHDTNTPGTFQNETVRINISPSFGQNHLALDPLGQPVVSYKVTTGDQLYAEHRVGGSWQQTLLTSGTLYTPAVTYHDGAPVAVYRDWVSGSFKVAWAKSTAWRPWSTRTLYPSSIYSADVDFDADGYIHVGFAPNSCRAAQVTTNRAIELADDFEAVGILGHRWPTQTGTPTVITPGITVPSGSNTLNLDGGTDGVESSLLMPTARAVWFDWAPTSLSGGVPESGDNLYLDWFNGSVWNTALTLVYNGTPNNTFARAGVRLPSTSRRVRLRSTGIDGSDNYLIDDVRVQREDGQWVGQVAADCVGVSRGLRIDVEVAPDGSRHMSHYDSTNRQLLYTTDESGSWVTTIIDDGGDGPGGLYAGEYHSLVLDSAGKAHIVYNRQGASYYNLWYATNAGGPWNTQQISTASGNEITVSLAIDQADKLHVGYRNTWTGPKYLSNAGGTWTGATPPGGGDATAVDIVVDSTGVVHMVWDNTSAAPDAVQYARRETTGAWSGEVVDGGTASRYPTLAVNGDGKVRVLYRREFQLGYAVRDVGGAWHKSTIGTEASEMPYDIAVSASGKVAIVYYNNTEAKLIEGYLDGVLSPASVRIPPPFE